MSVRRTVTADGDQLVVRERREIDLADLFDEDGRFIVHQDDDGWEGYRREQTDDGTVYYHHDDRREGDAHPFGVEMRVGSKSLRADASRLIEAGRLDPATLGGERT
jgi:hypothetical protein